MTTEANLQQQSGFDTVGDVVVHNVHLVPPPPGAPPQHRRRRNQRTLPNIDKATLEAMRNRAVSANGVAWQQSSWSLRAQIAMALLAMLLIVGIAAVTALSVVLATTGGSSRRRDRRLQQELDAQEDQIIALQAAIANISVVPRFPDDEFSVFSAADPSKDVMLDVTANLDSGSTVFWTSQNVSGIVAYLGDITGGGISGNYTPIFSSIVRYGGVPTTSQMAFFQVGSLVTVSMTVFGITSPVGTGLNSFNFDLPVAPVDTFNSAIIVGFGALFQLGGAAALQADLGFVIQVVGTRLVTFRSRNTVITTAVGLVVPLRFTYML